LCYVERVTCAVRAARRNRLVEWGRHAMIGLCLATSGTAGLGMALLPIPARLESDVSLVVARTEVRVVGDAIDAYAATHGDLCPSSLLAVDVTATDPWGEQLLFGCVERPRSFLVVSKGPDRELGTGDDLVSQH
jgi:hypothetical protein